MNRLLASCDRRTLAGRRDYAILLLLARLGLRAGEVAGLQLDDIDGQRQHVLPEVGQVLRHCEQKTTAIYAKVDRIALRALARPWPSPAGAGVTALRAALAGYLQIRRRLGFAMPQDGRLLEGFVEFLEQAGAGRITTELALRWARLPG